MVATWRFSSGGMTEEGQSPAPIDIGINIYDTSSGGLAYLPEGAKGLVWLGADNGLTQALRNEINACRNKANLWGFYVIDEPHDMPARNIKDVCDFAASVCPQAERYAPLWNFGSNNNPTFGRDYTKAATNLTIFGLDPYMKDNEEFDFGCIQKWVSACQRDLGISPSDMCAVIGTFGGVSPWHAPTDDEMRQILQAWDQALPNPKVEGTYAWSVQDEYGDTDLSRNAGWQAIFKERYSGQAPPDTGNGGGEQPPTDPPTVQAGEFFAGTETPAFSMGRPGDFYSQNIGWRKSASGWVKMA